MTTFILASDMGSQLAKGLSSQNLWVNVVKTVVFILLGFIFTKKKLLPETTGKILTKFVMAVCLPCLAFCSFMSDFTVSAGIDAVVNFVLGFVFYIGFIFLSKLIFMWVPDKKKRTVLSVLFAFGSTTFFAYPLISSIYGKTAGNDFNIMNVAYRVFLYSYAYIAIAEAGDEEVDTALDPEASSKPAVDKSAKAILKKIFLNPIVIATFAGLILWVLQAIPGVNFIKTNPYTGATLSSAVAFWRFDVTLPWFYQAANTLGGLSSTIILFAIGCTLGGTNIKEAATDKYAWIWTAMKVIGAPIVILLVLFALQGIGNAAGWLKDETSGVSQLISMNTVASSIMTWMVPPATVAVGYCINFDKEKEMASHISLISTFGAVIGAIIWIIVIAILNATGFFYGTI